MTLPRMIIIAIALLVPVVWVALVLADWLEPMLDRQSLLAQSLAYAGYAITGAIGGFVFGGHDSSKSPQFSAPRARDRAAFNRKFAIVIGVLLFPLFFVNLFVVPDRTAFLLYELRVFSVLVIGGVLGFAVRRIIDSREGRI